MSSLGARAVVFCFPIITGWLPLAAQSSSYHLEFDDRVPGHQDVILVNDSEKLIEAYGASQRCRRSNGRNGSGADVSQDILDDPHRGVRSDMHAAVGSSPSRSGVLETGGRWDAHIAVFAENGACDTQVTGVLFSDGSFDGEDAAVRGLKAHRDGLAAGVNYWADRIGREKPDGSTLDALLAEVRQRESEDQLKQRKYPITLNENTPPLLWQYWSGWLRVEKHIEFHFPKDLSREKARENLRKIADEINQWKNKIDGNLALQKLNVTFPAISESEDRQ